MATKHEKAVKAVAKAIIPVSEAEPYVKLLAYGRHGAGKTRLAATAPRCLIVDVNERGTRSARLSGAKVIHAKKWEDITYIFWYLRNGNHKFESVAVDTVTGMQHLCMKRVLRESEDRDPSREPSMPDRRAWGKLAELMKPMILNYRNLPMHVIFLAQERTTGDPEEGEDIMHVPDVSPGSRGVLMGSVDVIGRMYQKEQRKAVKKGKKKKETRVWEDRMLVGPHEQFETKDRTGALGRIVINPTMPQIIEAAFSEEDE